MIVPNAEHYCRLAFSIVYIHNIHIYDHEHILKNARFARTIRAPADERRWTEEGVSVCSGLVPTHSCVARAVCAPNVDLPALQRVVPPASFDVHVFDSCFFMIWDILYSKQIIFMI